MRASIILLLVVCAVASPRAQTLEECQQGAQRNYPLIAKSDLLRQTTDINIDNIGKGWLPQVAATAQATLQSDVTAFPRQMHDIYQQMGVDMKGLRKDQYRIGVDVQQMVYDGGNIRLQKDIARQQGEIALMQNEVDMYGVRQRVNDMYFALLLLDAQIQLNRDLQQVLEGNERKLASMYKNGTAAESDYLNVKAERLNALQQLTTLQKQRQTVAQMLTLLCGINVQSPVKPHAIVTAAGNNRPELRVSDLQMQLADTKEEALRAALMPKVSVFAQGYYGYPGMNMFDDMLHRRWSLNGIVGARITWNIGALYTHKNDKARQQLLRHQAANAREVFLLNNQLEATEHDANIALYRQLMDDDVAIIRLRAQVRRAAESKLAHGIIDANDLVREIKAENAALLQQSMHEIQMLREMYQRKITTNN